MNKGRSAKDLAFEKERVKFRQRIRELSADIDRERKENVRLYETIREKDELLRQKDEWIERLLEYTEMSKEDLQTLLNSEKQKEQALEHMNAIFGIGSKSLSSGVLFHPFL